jgi:hypothetical protein
MKKPLQKFTNYSRTLMPHEVAYLTRIEQFADPQNRSILERVFHNTRFPTQELAFDTSIDKRKYSKLKLWIQKKLHQIDVDRELNEIQKTEFAILTDDVDPEQERRLARKMEHYRSDHYHFIRFYELIERYRQFLLIRLRYTDHDRALEFIKSHQKEYERAKQTDQQLYAISQDIVDQYRTGNRESKKWESWLISVFKDKRLDGLNRYTALVRLTFIHFNYRDFVGLLPLYEEMDKLLEEGQFYSRNILANYYSNRLILHAKNKEWPKAERYGYLSIKHKNKDYLHYINTLVGILLREKKYAEALGLMQEAFPAMKETNSFHNKSGFISFYVRTLLLNERPKEAQRFAENFLSVYEKELFHQRWHTFFTFYLETLVTTRNWKKILELDKKFKLLDRDQSYSKKATYLPAMNWYIHLAKYKEGIFTEDEVNQQINQQIKSLPSLQDKQLYLKEILQKLRTHEPALFKNLLRTVGTH